MLWTWGWLSHQIYSFKMYYFRLFFFSLYFNSKVSFNKISTQLHFSFAMCITSIRQILVFLTNQDIVFSFIGLFSLFYASFVTISSCERQVWNITRSKWQDFMINYKQKKHKIHCPDKSKNSFMLLIFGIPVCLKASGVSLGKYRFKPKHF